MRPKPKATWFGFPASIVLVTALAGADPPRPDLDARARAVLAGGREAEAAVADLRQAGPDGMERALAAAAAAGPLSPAGRDALDRVCGVRDCDRIRLFWHTDLDRALAAARASGRPILSLALLGRLDEDLSCANSRFFRSVLYPDPEIGRLLRERFVLHWRSERPVPKLTVDFGDGRTLERTVTGNSIHYVLDANGRVVDALPGLYGPQLFRAELTAALEVAEGAARLGDGAFRSAAAAHRSGRIAALEPAWRALEGELRAAVLEAAGNPWELPAGLDLPTARLPFGGREAMTKSGVEVGALRALGVGRSGAARPRAARLVPSPVRLGPESRGFVLSKHGIGPGAAADRLIADFERTIALDEVINQYLVRPTIYARWASLPGLVDLEELNRRVYAEVFGLSPDDPWMGLVPEGVYAALPAPGRTEPNPGGG